MSARTEFLKTNCETKMRLQKSLEMKLQNHPSYVNIIYRIMMGVRAKISLKRV